MSQGGGQSGGGQGGGTTANYTEPGWATNVMVPLMRAIGLGIAARGGALGPMLASGGDSIASYYQDKRDQAVQANLLKILQPTMRSESTGGVPIERPGALAEPEAAGTMPLQPGVPPTRREWMGMPNQSEVLARIVGGDVPENLQGLVSEKAMRLKLPSDVERPQAVTEDLERARSREEESRKGALYGQAFEPTATAQTRGAAAAAGMRNVPMPETGTRVQYTENGRKQTIDTATGNVIGDEPMHRPDEQAVLDKAKRGEPLNEYEQRVFDTLYKPPVHARPPASESAQLQWLAAQNPPLPDTAPNRERARKALADEASGRIEGRNKRLAEDQTKLQADLAKRAGGAAVQEINKLQHQAGLLDQAESMADSMETAIVKLAKFSGEGSTFNWVRQQAASKAGLGPHHKEIADALATVQASNARYAAIAQGVEGITGNRLALTLAERMRAMHVHEEEPLSRNRARLKELRSTIAGLRGQINRHAADVIRRQQETMESVGKPGSPLSTYGDVAGRPGGRTPPPNQDLGDEEQ